MLDAREPVEIGEKSGVGRSRNLQVGIGSQIRDRKKPFAEAQGP